MMMMMMMMMSLLRGVVLMSGHHIVVGQVLQVCHQAIVSDSSLATGKHQKLLDSCLCLV